MDYVPAQMPFTTPPLDRQRIMLFITLTNQEGNKEVFMFIGTYNEQNRTLNGGGGGRPIYQFRLYAEQTVNPDLFRENPKLLNDMIRRDGKYGEIIPYTKGFVIEIESLPDYMTVAWGELPQLHLISKKGPTLDSKLGLRATRTVKDFLGSSRKRKSHKSKSRKSARRR